MPKIVDAENILNDGARYIDSKETMKNIFKVYIVWAFYYKTGTVKSSSCQELPNFLFVTELTY